MPKGMLKQLMLKQEQEEDRGYYAPALLCFATLRIRRDNQEDICL